MHESMHAYEILTLKVCSTIIGIAEAKEEEASRTKAHARHNA